MKNIILLKMDEMIRIQLELLSYLTNKQDKKQKIKLTDHLLDAQDVMQILHISPRTLSRYRKKGTLPFSKIEGKIFYSKTDIETLIKIF